MTDTANAPERIWMTAEDHGASWHGAFRAFRCSNLDHSNDDGPNPDYPEYVLATHCDELVAAAYLDAIEIIRMLPELILMNADQVRAIEKAGNVLSRSGARTNASAALTAYGERMKAEGALEAHAKIARLTEALKDAVEIVHKSYVLATMEAVNAGPASPIAASHDAWRAKCVRAEEAARAALQENKNV